MLPSVRPVPIALLLAALAADAPRPAHAEEAPLTRLPVPADLAETEEWYGLYLQGVKCGYAKETRRRTEKDGPWVMAMEMRAELKSLGADSTLVTREVLEFEAAAPHALLRALSETDQDGQKQRVEMVRKDGRYVATITTAGASRQVRVDAVDYTLADETTEEVWLGGKPAIGASVRMRTFDVEELEPDVTKLTVLSESRSIASGVPVRIRTVGILWESDGTESAMRVDEAGKFVSMTMDEIIEMRLEPKHVAQDLDVPTDLFVIGLAKVDKPVGDNEGVVELVLEVQGDRHRVIVDGSRQRVRRDEKTGVVVLSTGKAHGVPQKAAQDETSEALAETVEYPSKQPAVVALARKAVGDAATDREKVRRLVRFVSDYVEDAIAADALTVEHVIQRKKGDCTEHALLFTALARAAGIPCREVSGLLYVGDEMQAFGGHAWNEVVLDGVWVEVDATWDQTEIDATHIRLGAGAAGDTAIARTLGRLSFVLRSVKRSD